MGIAGKEKPKGGGPKKDAASDRRGTTLRPFIRWDMPESAGNQKEDYLSPATKAGIALELLGAQKPAAGLQILGGRQRDDKTWRYTKGIAEESVRTGPRNTNWGTKWQTHQSTMRGNYREYDASTLQSTFRSVSEKREQIAKMS